MKKVKRIKNNLSSLLEAKNITQKELAKKIGITEATLSDFLNLKRSTINIELVNKILTEMADDIVSIDDVFSIVETFKLDLYREDRYYKSPTIDNIYFSYNNNPNNSYVETLELLEDGRIFVSRLNISIEDFIPEKIAKRFETYKNTCDDLDDIYIGNKDVTFIHQFIIITIYEGILKDVQKYKNKEEALEVIEMLYL